MVGRALGKLDVSPSTELHTTDESVVLKEAVNVMMKNPEVYKITFTRLSELLAKTLNVYIPSLVHLPGGCVIDLHNMNITVI